MRVKEQGDVYNLVLECDWMRTLRCKDTSPGSLLRTAGMATMGLTAEAESCADEKLGM